jgi:hypothetical protein
MPKFRYITAITPATPSPLMVCDRLIGLAQDADRAGLDTVAERLLAMVDRMFDEGQRGKRSAGGWVGHA